VFIIVIREALRVR